MSNTVRRWDVDRSWPPLPPVRDLAPPGHLTHFVRDTVREALDLPTVVCASDEERGYPPHHPGMTAALSSTADDPVELRH